MLPATVPGETYSLIILVHLAKIQGGYNKMPKTGWLRSNRNLFHTVLEAGKSKIKVLVEPASRESPLPGL